jgi:hypothetical protein
MSCLEELQKKQEPITLEKMAAIQKEYEHKEKNTEKLIFEHVFQSVIVKYLTEKIGEKGAANEFSLIWDYQGYFFYKAWTLNGDLIGITMSDSLSNEFRDYVKERMDTLFPDYIVVCEFILKNNGFCWSKKKNLVIKMYRKDTQEKKEDVNVSENDVLLTSLQDRQL